MIACIIIVSLAFIWLGYESRWFTIRLPVGAVRPSITEYNITTNTDDDVIETSTIKFIPLSIPNTKGTITIRCERN